MLSRRKLLKTLAIGVSAPIVITNAALPQKAELAVFDNFLQSVIADEDIVSAGRELRERQIEEFDYYATRAVAPRKGRSSRTISERAIKLIVSFEVTSEQMYRRKYQGAIWPKGASGVTVGIGYDVGYVIRAWLYEDWGGLIEPTTLSQLEIAVGKKGEAAGVLLPQLNAFQASWSTAYRQFRERTLPLYIAETTSALPNCDKLSDKSLGALVSLVYNRGASFRNVGDRYSEMRAIRLHMVQERFELIPNELLSMKRIWEDNPSMRGLLARRELEAKLFQAGLS